MANANGDNAPYEARTRGRLPAFAKLGLSLSTLAYVFWLVPLNEVARLIGKASVPTICAALAIGVLTQLVSALRFVRIAHALGAPLHWRRMLPVHFTGLWMNQLLPTGLGGDVVRVVMLRRDLGTGVAIRVGILDRVSGLVILLVHVALFGPLYSHLYPGVPALLALSGLSVLALLMMALVFLAPQLRARLLQRQTTALLGRFLEDLRTVFTPPHLYWQVATSLAVHLNGIVAFVLIAQALGIAGHHLDLSLLTPIVFLIALLPFSFAGWGLREVGAIGVFGIAGVSASQALAITILYGFMLIAIALPGLWFLMRENKGA